MDQRLSALEEYPLAAVFRWKAFRNNDPALRSTPRPIKGSTVRDFTSEELSALSAISDESFDDLL